MVHHTDSIIHGAECIINTIHERLRKSHGKLWRHSYLPGKFQGGLSGSPYTTP